MRHLSRSICLVSAAMLMASTPATAQENKTYTYDALGRLVTVKKAGGPNDQTTSTYDYDKAGNRTQVSTSGSANGGGGGNNGGGASVGTQQGFVVTPLGGYTLLFYRN